MKSFDTRNYFSNYNYTEIILVLILTILFQVSPFQNSFAHARSVELARDFVNMTQTIREGEELIRFHVVANSDSAEDQALKVAVRDAILKVVAPKLASAQSLDESRRILTDLRPTMEAISQEIITAWGRDLEVKTDHGKFIFPTKSYGSLVLPAGEYEAVRVIIGEGKGSNWWCVLFPPLCFIDIEHSTAQVVDGKAGIPYKEPEERLAEQKQVKDQRTIADQFRVEPSKANKSKADRSMIEKPKVKFWILEKLLNQDIKN